MVTRAALDVTRNETGLSCTEPMKVQFSDQVGLSGLLVGGAAMQLMCDQTQFGKPKDGHQH